VDNSSNLSSHMGYFYREPKMKKSGTKIAGKQSLFEIAQ
jgi:hypothetical protein